MLPSLLATAAKTYNYSPQAADGLFATGFGLTFICFYCGIILVGLILGVLWIWMLIDLIMRKDTEFGPDSSSDKRVIWLLIVLLTGWIGSIIYYFVIYKKYPRIK